jgi:signal transduction histidine kinase
MAFLFHRTSVLAFGTVAVALLIVAASGYRTVVSSRKAYQLVAPSYKELYTLEDVFMAMVDAETGTRGFDTTGASRYLERFEWARSVLPRRIDSFAALTVENPVQQREVAELRAQTTVTMRLLEEIVSIRRSKHTVTSELREREKTSMDAVRVTLGRMRSEEQDLIEHRNAAIGRAASLTQTSVLSLILGAFAVLALSFLFVNQRAVELGHLNAILEERVRERTARLEASLANERAARAEADAANRSKDVFLARVSHELRTPLNVMMGWAQMLRDKTLAQTKVAQAVASITRNGELLQTLVGDLIEMSRLTTGTVQLNRSPLDIVPIVRESMSLLESSANAKDIRVQMNHESESIVVNADPTRLRQVLWNLLSNAIKFTPPKGSVVLRVRQAGNEAEISVTDSGRGISSDFLPHVFEPFSQAGGDGQGLGLGLAIARQLVQAHEGRIAAVSPGADGGATFTVFLPVVATEKEGQRRYSA